MPYKTSELYEAKPSFVPISWIPIFNGLRGKIPFPFRWRIFTPVCVMSRWRIFFFLSPILPPSRIFKS